MMGETHAAGPSAATAGSNKAKKKSQKHNSGKSKRKDELKTQAAAADGVGQVQFTFSMYCCALLL